MSDTFYSKSQVDAILAVVGNRIENETAIAKIRTELDALPDVNLMTDAERAKLAGLEDSKYLGVFSTSGDIPTIGAVAGSYADVDAGVGLDAERWIYDVDDAVFVKSVGSVAGETSASVKLKYESNANTNAFTDAEKTKLGLLSVATDTTSAVAALDGAIS